MKRRALMLALASLLLAGAHLRPVYRVSVDGERLDGLYEPETLRAALEAAHWAAEEIARSEAQMPAVRISRLLRLRRGNGEEKALFEALLDGCGGVAAGDGVWVNGESLGVVPEGVLLLSELYDVIVSHRPEGAAVGNLSGLLRLARVYTSPERVRPENEMLPRVLAAAPVFYVDWHGRIVAG